MEGWQSIVAVCVVSAIFLSVIDVILVPRLNCRKTDLIPVVLRSLILLAGILILQPQARNNIFLSSCFAMGFDYLYSRMFKS